MTKKILSGLLIGAMIVAFGALSCNGAIPEVAANVFADAATCFCLAMSFCEITSMVISRKFFSPIENYLKSVFFALFEFAILLITLILAAEDFFSFRDYLLAIVVCGATDAGGGIIGRLLGKTHLRALEKISANKTKEGYFGGFVFAVIVSMAFAPIFYHEDSILGLYVIIGTVAAMLGDLLASHLKRCFKVKDSAELLWSTPALSILEWPLKSHGGYLDRMDSISAGLIALALLKCITP